MSRETRYKPGDRIGGRYQVHVVFPPGGMGEVYLCWDQEEDFPYAVKTLKTPYSTNPRIQGLFRAEVAAWIELESHPNIVRCFFMDTIDNQPFMFLEPVITNASPHSELRRWLLRGPLELRLALSFTIDICRGLVHAQRIHPGIVHCDLKPENILIGSEQLVLQPHLR
jgi:serine/threonine protein kinase